MSYFNKAQWDRLAQLARRKRAQAFDREPFAPPAGVGPDFDAIADQAQRLYRSQMDGQLRGYEAKLLYAELAESVGGTYDQLMEWMFGAKNAKQAQAGQPLRVLKTIENPDGSWAAFFSDGRAAEFGEYGDPGAWADTGEPISESEWEQTEPLIDQYWASDAYRATQKQGQFKGLTPSRWFEVTEGQLQDWLVVRGTMNGEPIDVLLDPSDRGEVGGYMKDGEIVEQCPPEWETDIDPIAQQFLMRYTAQFNPTPDQQMDRAQFQDWQIEETSTLGTCESCLTDGPVSDINGRDLCKYCKVEQGMGSQFEPAMEQAMGQHMGRKAQFDGGPDAGDVDGPSDYSTYGKLDLLTYTHDWQHVCEAADEIYSDPAYPENHSTYPPMPENLDTNGVDMWVFLNDHGADPMYACVYHGNPKDVAARINALPTHPGVKQAQLGLDPDSTYNSGWEEEVNEAEFPGGIEQQERLEPGMRVEEGPLPNAPRVMRVTPKGEGKEYVEGDIVTVPSEFEVTFGQPEYGGYGTYEATRTDLYQVEKYEGGAWGWDPNVPLQTIYTIGAFIGSDAKRGWDMWLDKHKGPNNKRPYDGEIWDELTGIWEAYMEHERADEAAIYG